MVQKALIRFEGKYLVLLRGSAAPTFPLHWDLPGGGVEKGENPISAINREIKEETGLVVNNVKLFDDFVIALGEAKQRYVVYIASSNSSDVHISYEHDKYLWCTKDNILQLKAEPFLLKLVQDHYGQL